MDIITQLRDLGFQDLTYDVARLQPDELVQRALHLDLTTDQQLVCAPYDQASLHTGSAQLEVGRDGTKRVASETRHVASVSRQAADAINKLVDKALERGYTEVVELVRRSGFKLTCDN